MFRLSENNNLAFSQAFSGGVVTWTTTTNAVQLNAWQHVAVTYAGGGVNDIPKIYLNGVEQTLSGWTPYGSLDNDAGYDIKMGIMTTVQEFDGLMDEVAILNRILTSAQINEIMTGGLAGGGAGGTVYENTVDAGGVTSFTVTGLANGTTYYFVVAAYNTTGEGPLSNEDSAAPAALPPAAPVLNTPLAGDTQVDLTWSSVTEATGYKVYWGTASGTFGAPVDVGNVTQYTVTGLTNATRYYFAVTAKNGSGESVRSNEASAVPFSMVVEPQVFVEDVAYNAQGQITRLTYGNGVVITYTYAPLTLRLSRIYTVGTTGAVIQDLNYAYDSVGNILSITDHVNTADQTFQYDELNRLVRANGQAYGLKTYAYDTIGNITEKDGRLYFYGGNGVGDGGPHAVTSLSNGTTFTYDANGNMLSKQTPDLITTGYAYDAENRLVAVRRAGALIAEYTYDGDGGRTAKTAHSASNAQGTCFLAGTPVLTPSAYASGAATCTDLRRPAISGPP